MHIVVAPDAFKGTLSASEAAQAIVRGARRVFPAASFQLRPVADGGEGTLDALVTAVGGTVRDVDVTGPLGERVRAPLAFLADGRTAVEMSTASGLVLVPESKRDPRGATSKGTGELLRAALEAGRPGEVVVGIGGSASTDGGTGAATAVGWRFLDGRGNELPPGGASLVNLARIDSSGVLPQRRERTIVAACDVDNGLLGPAGAARVYGPQKGATLEDVEILEEALSNLADRIRADVGIDVTKLRGGGAGGGIGAGMVAFFGAELGRGFEIVSDATELDAAVTQADIVITGEGRLDSQSLKGKAPISVAKLARKHRVRCFAVAGDLAVESGRLRPVGITGAVGVVQAASRERAMTDPSGAITDAVAGLLSAHFEQDSRRRPPRRRFIFF